MNTVKEFKGSYVQLYSNALHNGFHTAVWQYLRGLEDKTKITRIPVGMRVFRFQDKCVSRP